MKQTNVMYVGCDDLGGGRGRNGVRDREGIVYLLGLCKSSEECVSLTLLQVLLDHID